VEASTVIARLTDVFRDVFDNDAIALRDDMTARDIEGWDSLANIRLILSVEQAFNVRFDVGEIQELRNVGNLVAAITRRVG
jgi:acyl carrier protein